MSRKLPILCKITPLNVWRELTADEDVFVRMIAAESEYAPAESLSESAKDPDPYVRAAAAMNGNISDKDLDSLMANDAEESFVIAAIADNPKVKSDRLDRLAESKYFIVRMSVADCERASKATLRKLSFDSANYVKLKAAGNTSTPKDALERLSRDPDSSVSEAALKTLGIISHKSE